jgi:hypothetical protein
MTNTHRDVRAVAAMLQEKGGAKYADLDAEMRPRVDRLISCDLMRCSGEWVVFTLEGLRLATQAGVKHGGGWAEP